MKIGIITYHAAYNYGSVLQAYATQTAIKTLGYDTKIINYRMDEQAEYYQHMYRTKYGIKTFIKDLALFPLHRQRQTRAKRFESFFKEKFKLTAEINGPEQFIKQVAAFDIAVSGSDQIWNKHSCELEHNDWRFMNPYLLKGFTGRKVSYASSIGNMTDSELQKIVPELQQFDVLSFRESSSAKKMSEFLDCSIQTVLDPTFLLTKDDWINSLDLHNEAKEQYILYYSLSGPKKISLFIPNLLNFAKKSGHFVKIITPFSYLPYPDKRLEYHFEYGPIEFLNALYNAKAVITDSYHGTILSVNFKKDLYSICSKGGAEFRKTDILARLGMKDRIITDINDIVYKNFKLIDYDSVYRKLDVLRQESYNYLRKAFDTGDKQ